MFELAPLPSDANRPMRPSQEYPAREARPSERRPQPVRPGRVEIARSGSWRGGRSTPHSAQVLPSRLLVLLLALASVFLLFSSRVEAGQPTHLREHVVAAGDTLWSIAAEVSGEDEDVRAVVSLLRRVNELEGATIVPGQRLLVPTR